MPRSNTSQKKIRDFVGEKIISNLEFSLVFSKTKLNEHIVQKHTFIIPNQMLQYETTTSQQHIFSLSHQGACLYKEMTTVILL